MAISGLDNNPQLTRLPDWQRRLFELVEARRSTPFAWGRHDCCTWAAECVQAITGVDLSETWRGKYDSALSAQRYLKTRWGSLPAALESLGLVPIPPESARRGDLGLVSTSRLVAKQALGVCLVRYYAFPGLEQPMAFLGRDQILKAWRVG